MTDSIPRYRPNITEISYRWCSYLIRQLFVHKEVQYYLPVDQFWVLNQICHSRMIKCWHRYTFVSSAMSICYLNSYIQFWNYNENTFLCIYSAKYQWLKLKGQITSVKMKYDNANSFKTAYQILLTYCSCFTLSDLIKT